MLENFLFLLIEPLGIKPLPGNRFRLGVPCVFGATRRLIFYRSLFMNFR